MLRYALQRLALTIAVALTASVVAFILLNVAIDPAAAIVGDTDDPFQVEVVRQQLGLDRPIPVRYLEWLGGLLQGDFGTSYVWSQPVAQLVLAHAPVTIRLAFLSLCVTIVIALPLGIAAALRRGGAIDQAASAISSGLQASPNFWIGLLLIMVFAVNLRLVPVSGDEDWINYLLPAIVLGTSSVPNIMRLARSGMIEVLDSDYIRTARAIGYRGWPLLHRQALRNALLPVVSVLALELGNKLGGSLVTEYVFAMDGLGRLAHRAILSGDIPTLQMLVLIFAVTFVLMTYLADLLNAWLDPRIRLA